MKVKQLIKTSLVLLAVFSLTLFNSCDKVDQEDYISMLAGTWLLVEEWEDGVAVDVDDLETYSLTFQSDYIFYLTLSGTYTNSVTGATSNYNTTYTGGVFEIYGNKIIGTFPIGSYDGILYYEIQYLTAGELIVENNGSGLAVLKSRFVKQAE